MADPLEARDVVEVRGRQSGGERAAGELERECECIHDLAQVKRTLAGGHDPAVLAQQLHRPAGDRALAHSARPGQHGARVAVAAQRPQEPTQLRAAAHQVAQGEGGDLAGVGRRRALADRLLVEAAVDQHRLLAQDEEGGGGVLGLGLLQRGVAALLGFGALLLEHAPGRRQRAACPGPLVARERAVELA